MFALPPISEVETSTVMPGLILATINAALAVAVVKLALPS